MIQFLGMLLLVRLVDPYEREPMAVVGLMALWGATFAVAIGLGGNEFVVQRLPVETERVFGAALSAPLVEEFGKGAALLVAFLFSRYAAERFGTFEFDGVTDGIVYGAAIGLGFAFTENVFYFMRSLEGQAELQEAVKVFNARAGFLGLGSLGHAVYTGTFGAGLGLATWSWRRRDRIAFPVLGFIAAVLMHATYNGLAQLLLTARFGLREVAAYFECTSIPGCSLAGYRRIEEAASGSFAIAQVLDKVFLVAFGFGLVLWIRYQRRVIREELMESAEAGLFPAKEADVLVRFWRRSRWYSHLWRRGRYEEWRLLRTMHAYMIDLALTKRRLRRTGPEGRWRRVDELWKRIREIRVAISPASGTVGTVHVRVP